MLISLYLQENFIPRLLLQWILQAPSSIPPNNCYCSLLLLWNVILDDDDDDDDDVLGQMLSIYCIKLESDRDYSTIYNNNSQKLKIFYSQKRKGIKKPIMRRHKPPPRWNWAK